MTVFFFVRIHVKIPAVEYSRDSIWTTVSSLGLPGEHWQTGESQAEGHQDGHGDAALSVGAGTEKTGLV